MAAHGSEIEIDDKTAELLQNRIEEILKKKGNNTYLIGRLKRLGIPFLFGAVIIAPLAFYPSFMKGASIDSSPYLSTFFTSDGWPVGPPWFLWVLLTFDLLLVMLVKIKSITFERLSSHLSPFVIYLVTIISFLPFNMIGSHYYWWTPLGPFDLQPVRIGLYFTYFLIGAILGTGQQWRQNGWPKGWGYWLPIGFFSFIAYMVLMAEAISLPEFTQTLLLGITFASSCAGTTLGLLGLFRKIVHKQLAVVDNLVNNAYGIYLIHYAAVIWLQYLLLPVSWPVSLKFLSAFIGGLLISLGITTVIRKIPAARQIL